MKKQMIIWVLLCLLSAVLPMAAMAANGPSFSASQVSGCIGSTVEVSFKIQNNAAPGIVGAELKGSYDASKLEFVSAQNGSIMGSPICNTQNGNIYYSWDDSLTAGIVGDGVMCTLKFKILDTCKPGDQLDIRITQFKAHNTSLKDVAFQTANGAVTVSDHSWSQPTYTWSDDYKSCTATRSQTCNCGETQTETAKAAKKEETTQTIYTVSFKNTAFSTQTKKVAAGPVRVSFRLIGATLSPKGVDLSNGGVSDSQYVTWLPTKAFTLDAGNSVYDLIKMALDQAGLDYEMTSTYLSSIHAPSVLGGYELAELTNGSRSGWMYTVNGKHGSLSIGQQELKNGDVIIVHYVNDYLYEEDKFPWLEAEDVIPTAPVTPPDPQPTDPKPTEPADPQPTEPKPTQPQPSKPEPTDPQPTQPLSQVPQKPDGACDCWCCQYWWLLLLAGIAVNVFLSMLICKPRTSAPKNAAKNNAQ